MKPGSLVVYIGGQTSADVSKGFGLIKDELYVVDKVGWFMLGTPAKKRSVISLIERPNQVHDISMFREVQGPGEIDIQELFKVPLKEHIKKNQNA